jgi:predicted Zn-dependent protease
MMGFAATGAADDAERLLVALAEVAAGATTNARMAREVGLPQARGLWAFGRGDYAESLQQLMPIRFIAARAGGSHAQRDLLQMTCAEAAHRAGDHRLARALLNERLALKPSSPHNWLWLARSLAAAGDEPGADAARSRAAGLRASVA